MMRRLIVLALGLGLPASAHAQSAEIIIRRPGEKDQVIQLDSARANEELGKVELQLQQLRGTIKDRMGEMQKEMPAMQFKIDTDGWSGDVRTLALGAAELGKMVPSFIRWAIPSAAARPILGISVANDARESDKYGAYIASVTPGGPADKAGIRAGDIITKIDGKSLIAPENRAYQDDVSAPGLRLVELAARLEADKTVDIEFRRGNDVKTVKVTPVEDNTMTAMTAPRAFMFPPGAPNALVGRGSAPSAPSMNDFGGFAGTAPATAWAFGTDGSGGVVPLTPSYSFGFGGPLSNLELAPLNEKLGAYFGTAEGVLVVNTDSPNLSLDSIRQSADSVVVNGRTRLTKKRAVAPGADLGLEPGDVVVSVDGRKVASPAQLMRILSTYDRGEEFKLQIMRQKHSETLTAKLP